MGAVGRPGEASEVVAEVFAVEEVGAVGKDDVVPGEAFSSSGGGRNKEGGAGAKVEVDKGTTAVGNIGEGTVER